MIRLAQFLLITSAGWLFYVYLGYPICLWILTFFRQRPHVSDESVLPTVSVLIAARNEEKDIEWKVRQTLAWDYPADRLEVLVASDASDDHTDEILSQLSDPRLHYVRIEERGGKVRALNHLARVAKGELLFFTDSNSNILPEALRRLVRHFADPRVGCVTGADRTAPEVHAQAIGSGESVYWKYELAIDELESRLGSVLVCFGAIHCIRRSLYAACDPDLANDLEVPIRIGGAGYLVLFEPGAVSLEVSTSSPKEEFHRRRRICGQGAVGLFRLYECIHGLRAWQFFSRKLLRWLAVLPLATIFIATAWMASNNFLVSRLLLICQIGFYTAAAVGWCMASRGRKVGKLLALPFYFVLVNLAALAGVVDACRGRRYAIWSVASLTRGASTVIAEADVVPCKFMRGLEPFDLPQSDPDGTTETPRIAKASR